MVEKEPMSSCANVPFKHRVTNVNQQVLTKYKGQKWTLVHLQRNMSVCWTGSVLKNLIRPLTQAGQVPSVKHTFVALHTIM